MYISKEKLTEIRKNHSTTIITDDDVVAAFEFVHDVLCAEADAMKQKAPYATVSIDRLEKAAHEVFSASGDIECEIFDEGGCL